MSLTVTDKKIAEHMSSVSRIPYTTASHFVGAFKSNNLVQLSILAEKHLMTAEQSETLKDNGLTVSDIVTNSYDVDSYAVAQWITREWNDALGYRIFASEV